MTQERHNKAAADAIFQRWAEQRSAVDVSQAISGALDGIITNTPDHRADMGATRAIQGDKLRRKTALEILKASGMEPHLLDLVQAAIDVQQETYALTWWSENDSDDAIGRLHDVAMDAYGIAQDYHASMRG